MRNFNLIATLAALASASPLTGQGAAGRGTLRGLSLEAGVTDPRTAPATAAFGVGAELGAAAVPGSFRLALAGWVADTPDGHSASGRDISLTWLLRSSALPAGGIRLFAAAGPALAMWRDAGSAGARVAAAAAAGLGIPLAPDDAMSLELRFAALAAASRPTRLSLGVGVRVRPAAGLLARGEPPPKAPPDVQPVAPPTRLDPVADASGGLLAGETDGGALELNGAAFTDSADLTLAAVAWLAAAGRTLAEIGADRVRVQIYAVPDSSGQLSSRRAVAVARALARGGFPAGRIALEVTPGDASSGAAGRILAGSRCVSDCVAPARPLQ